MDLDDTSSHRDRSTERDNSGASSPVSQLNSMTNTPAKTTSTASSSSPPELMGSHNNSNSSGVASGSSASVASGDTPIGPRKRGRPKGSFRKGIKTATGTGTTPADREHRRAESSSSKRDNSDTSDFAEFLDTKKKTTTTTPTTPPSTTITAAPPQLMDNNSSSSSAASSRPIRNRTKPKDKDFVYDLSSLKGDFIYEDDAMDTALSESMMLSSAATTLSSFTDSDLASTSTTTASAAAAGTKYDLSSCELPVKIAKKRMSSANEPRHHPAVNGSVSDSVGDPPMTLTSASKRSVGRPKTTKHGGQEEKRKRDVRPNKINWDKNVLIPTRIIEHRHSVETTVAHLKGLEMRRNSIDIMIKGGGGGGNIHQLKENSRPGVVVASNSPLGMIGNIMERDGGGGARDRDAGDGEFMKDFSGGLIGESSPRRHFESATVVTSLDHHQHDMDHHVLLNGRSLGEILSMSTNGIVQQGGERGGGVAVATGGVMED